MNREIRKIKIFKRGDFVVSELFKTSKGFPYVIKVDKVDEEFGVIEFIHNGQMNYIDSDTLRIASKIERFLGPIYDFLLK